MGCTSSVPESAFRHNINMLSMDAWAAKLGDTQNTYVLTVELESVSDLDPCPGIFNYTNPYVEVRLTPKDDIAGEQKQISSVKPHTLMPKWEPREVFNFFLTEFLPDNNEQSIIFSINQYSGGNKKGLPTPLADAHFKLTDVMADVSEIPKEFNFQLSMPGSMRKKGKITLMLSKRLVSEAMNVKHSVVYEYERYQPVRGWHSACLLPTDPGAWSTEDGKRYADTLQRISPKIPDGWTMTESWSIMATDQDPDGWQYTSSFEAALWYPQKNSSLYVVRRRPWHREIRKSGSYARDRGGHLVSVHTAASSNDNSSGNSNGSGSSAPAKLQPSSRTAAVARGTGGNNSSNSNGNGRSTTINRRSTSDDASSNSASFGGNIRGSVSATTTVAGAGPRRASAPAMQSRM